MNIVVFMPFTTKLSWWLRLLLYLVYFRAHCLIFCAPLSSLLFEFLLVACRFMFFLSTLPSHFVVRVAVDCLRCNPFSAMTILNTAEGNPPAQSFLLQWTTNGQNQGLVSFLVPSSHYLHHDELTAAWVWISTQHNRCSSLLLMRITAHQLGRHHFCCRSWVAIFDGGSGRSHWVRLAVVNCHVGCCHQWWWIGILWRRWSDTCSSWSLA